MSNVSLKAVNAIYRKERGKQVRHEPGETFVCTVKENEDEGYTARGAAVVDETAEKPKKKTTPKPKAAAEPKPKAAEPKGEKSSAKDTSEDDNLLS